MGKKNKIELLVSVILIILLFALTARAFKKFSRTKKAVTKRSETTLQGALSVPREEEQGLFWRLSEYAKKTEYKRDPFSLSPIVPAKTSTKGLSLSGIMWDRETPAAVINGRVAKEGDTVAGNTVIEILPDKVLLTDGIRNLELKLQ